MGALLSEVLLDLWLQYPNSALKWLSAGHETFNEKPIQLSGLVWDYFFLDV